MSRSTHRLPHKGQRTIWLFVALLWLSACEPPPLTAVSAAVPTLHPTALPSPTSLIDTPAPTTQPATATPSAVPTHTPTPTPSIAARPSPTAAPLSALERQQIFQEVWQLVADNYVYHDYNGVDWEKIREVYAPLVASAQSDDEFYGYMAEMVAQLGDEHSRFMPPAAVVSEDEIVAGREMQGIGVMTRMTADGAFVKVVFPDSPAARAGLRPRDRIIAVDGRPYQYDDGDLQGPVGSSVRLNIVRPGEKPRDIVLVREEVQGRIVPYYQRFPGDIGYLWITTMWASDMGEQVSGALTELVADGRLNGLIIDLRGNPGGWSHVLAGILSHFVRGQVGVFFGRHEIRPLEVSQSAGPDLRRLPLVVLIDGDTSSYAEVLAAVLQREANARVVGVPSAGNTETIYPYTLHDGSRIWLAREGFRLQNGVSLEGRGVQPDATVDVDWTRYSVEDDPQILEALHLLGAGPK